MTGSLRRRALLLAGLAATPLARPARAQGTPAQGTPAQGAPAQGPSAQAPSAQAAPGRQLRIVIAFAPAAASTCSAASWRAA